MYKIYLYKYLYKYIKKTQIEREEIYIYRNINIILYIKKNKEGNYLWENGRIQDGMRPRPIISGYGLNRLLVNPF